MVELRELRLRSGCVAVAGRTGRGCRRYRFTPLMIDPLEPRRLFAVGALDTTFNGTGKRAVDFAGVLDELYDVAVQTDGKIVAVGSKGTTNTYGNGGDFAVVRLLDNGTPDPAFGTNGIRLFDFAGDIERANAVAIQPNGQILVGGSTHAPGQFWGDWVVLRLNATDGSLDNAFGGGTGRVVTSFGSDDQLYDLALQSDGKIVAGGVATNGANRLGLARYNSDGTLDTTFDGDGKLDTYVNANNSEAAAIAVQADGKIVTTGTASSGGSGGGVRTLSICRFNANGSFDTTFGGTGWIVDNLGVAFPNAIAVAPDGGYFIATSVGSTSTTTQLRKYTSTGARATFGSSGAVTIGSGGLLGENIGLLVQANGYVVVAGTTSSQTNPYYGTTTIARVTPAGALDTTFNGTGKLVLPEGGNATAAAFDNQGRVVVALTAFSDGEVVRVSTEGVASAAGRLMKDTDGDGEIEAGDPALSGWTVYIDLDFDGVMDLGERRTTTDASGNWRFDGLHLTNPAGGYPFKVVMQSGYGSRLGSIQGFIGPTPGSTLDVGDWPIFFGKSVGGQVFNDANANGTQDAGENGLSGFDVYFDANANLRYDAGETLVTSNAQGQYTIAITAAGTLRLKWPIAYRQTQPTADGGRAISYSAGTIQTAVNFGATASTFTATGAYEIDKRYITFQFDRPIRSNNLQFSLTNLGTGQVYTVYNAIGYLNEAAKISFEPVIIGDPNSPSLPDGNYRAKLLAGSVRDNAGNLQPTDLTLDFSSLRGDFNTDMTVNDADYAILAANTGLASGAKYSQGDYNFSGAIDAADLAAFSAQFGKTLLTTPATISGSVFNDANANGVWAAGEAGLSGRTVYLDVNGNGALDTNEPTRTTASGGAYSFATLGPGNYAVRQVVPSGSRQTLPTSDGSRAIALAVSQVSSANDFGVTTLPGWVGAGSSATWNATSKTLSTSGALSIVADPAADNPIISAAGPAAAVTINPAAGGAVRLGQLNLSNEAIATFTAGGGERTLVVGSLSVTTGAKLDLTNHAMIVRSGGAAAVRSLLASGFNHGSWTGLGITSSAAATNPQGNTALGYASNADLNRSSFGGVTGLTSTDVLVKYTYSGDANLDGQVDIGDLGLLSGAWQQPSGKSWFDGDFTFDGAVDIGDLGLLSGNWQKGVGNPL